MNLHYLTEFLSIAELGSISAVAGAQFISIATLLRHMQSLEEQCGTVLFRREHGNVTLTETGQAFIPYARSMLSLYREYQLNIGTSVERPKQTIYLGTSVPLSSCGITGKLAEFMNSRPDISLEIRRDTTENLGQLLQKMNLDFAVIQHQGHIPDQLAEIPLFTLPLAAVLPEQHPLASCRSLSLSDLRGEPLILPAEFTCIRDLCLEAGLVPGICVETAAGSAELTGMVQAGLGIALLPFPVPAAGTGLVSRILNPSVNVGLSVIYNDFQKPGELSWDLIKQMQKSARERNCTLPAE